MDAQTDPSRAEIAPAASDARPALDSLDHRILAELRRDGRISVRTLAARVHLSRTRAHARVKRLEDSGVIRGYSARVDPAKVGLTTAAYITVNLRQSAWESFHALISEQPMVHHIALVGGHCDVVLLVRAPDVESLRRLVLDIIQKAAGVQATHTLIIFDEGPRRPAPRALPA